MPAIDIEKATKAIEGFGYTVGYVQTAMFVIGHPPSGRHVVVSVHELDRLAGADNADSFLKALDSRALTPYPGYVRDGTDSHVVQCNGT
jgi:hypothetical protein